MIQRNFCLAILIAMACLSINACQKDSPDNNDADIDMKIVGGNEDEEEYESVVFMLDDYEFDDQVLTKVLPDIDPSGIQYLWAEGDEVGIVPDQGSQLVFPVVETGGTTTSFDGGAWRLSSDRTYYAYVPLYPQIKLDKTKIPISFLGQVQTGNNSSTGLRDYVFMSASGTVPTGKNLVFNFKRLGCLLWIEIPVDAGTYTKLEMSILGEGEFLTNGYYDLTATTSTGAPSLIATSTSKKISLSLNNVVIAEDNSTLNCYMMCAPVNLSEATVKFTLTGNNGHSVYTASGKNQKKSGACKYSPDQMEGIIDFEDQIAKDICIDLWDTNSDGELQFSEAEVVTEIGGFQNKPIQKFNELQYFTNLSSISENAFDGCTSLQNISFPIGRTLSIGSYAFRNCKKMIIEGDALTISSVGVSSFENCNKISGSIILADGATVIPYNAFCGCSLVSSITIPSSVSSIETSAFQNCSSLTAMVLPDNAAGGDYAIFRGCSKLTELNIPQCWTKFGDDYFSGCTSFTSFTVPSNIKELGDRCFQGCTSLKSITMHDGLMAIDENCFRDCASLDSIVIPNKIHEIDHGTFAGCTKLSSVILPEGLESINSRGDGAFADCKSLTHIQFPSTLQYIDEYSFISSGLVSVTLPQDLISVGKAAFGDCNNMTECILSQKIKILQRGIFGFTRLATLTIPASVDMLFDAGIPNTVEDLYFLSPTPPILFDNKVIPDNGCPIYVPSSAVDTYKASPVWIEFADRIQEIPGGNAGGDTGGKDPLE